MKISKLFHWLYALVMLLPIFAIGVTCGYAMFNKNAYKSTQPKSISNVELISMPNDLVDGLDYTIKYKETTLNGQTGIKIKYSNISINWSDYGASSQYIYVAFFMQRLQYAYVIYLYDSTLGQPIQTLDNVWGNTLNEFNFTKLDTQTINRTDAPCNFYLITYINETLDNVFYYAVDKVTESPLFSWAYDSFLVAPFAYIVALFGMPTNSVIVQLLSYWLAISIIWLVFDLVMYVPLLIHRWLDKGVLE